jgi:hypothetical protein
VAYVTPHELRKAAKGEQDAQRKLDKPEPSAVRLTTFELEDLVGGTRSRTPAANAQPEIRRKPGSTAGLDGLAEARSVA